MIIDIYFPISWTVKQQVEWMQARFSYKEWYVGHFTPTSVSIFK
jgi:hypothetical protein